ncbi:hypothetical protein HHL16_13810 [Pseudoflavitalea sp. G-6-1-2]|uniref:hypothetical protein n=1 Tax=Pseudoflavitalea sp. G-6-1-2 TaxID=2728841 RepID=UPI00146E1829|nr:hypothetical protein [Pseudoflavitalea sp. G-6-1-2]NML21960.1 hypothetical protein [Pseudoflavitalea sp. G-6-1-2]
MFKKLFIWTIALLLSYSTWAQSASGSWYGKADVVLQGSFSNYLTELIIQQKGNEIEGVFGYYFKDTYQSFFVRGKYNKETREVTIPNLPMLLYASTARNGIECPMTFIGKLLVSQAQSTMNGSFYPNDKYKYTCPELKVNFTMDRTEGTATAVLRNMAVGQRFWKPQEEDHVVEAEKKAEPVKEAIAKTETPEKKEEVIVKVETPVKKAEEVIAKTEPPTAAQRQAELIREGEAAKKEAEVAAKEAAAEKKTIPSTSIQVPVGVSKSISPAENNGVKVTPVEQKIADAYKKRKNIYNKDIEVESDSIRITFYDNGDIDGDTISVFLNGEPVLTNQMITDRGTNIYVKLDEVKSVNEISMFAQNLGKFPPNTALMVVTDGNTRYEVYLSSSLTQNATVRLVRKKRDSDHRLKLR